MDTINPNYLKMTRARLNTYMDTKSKLTHDLQDVRDLQKEGPTTYSRDIIRLIGNSTIRIDPADIHQMRIDTLMNDIREAQREILRIDTILSDLSQEPYIKIIPLKFFDHLTEQAIAQRLNCDTSTVYRHKTRLLHRISLRLYGNKALHEIIPPQQNFDVHIL